MMLKHGLETGAIQSTLSATDSASLYHVRPRSLMLLQCLSIKIQQRETMEHSAIAWKETCPLLPKTAA
jgi:hypothetical protein